VRFACVENNKWHSLGRGGSGAAMGSKKLKGVVFHGDRKVEAARPDEFKALVKDMAVRAKDDPGVAAYRRGGTVNMVRLINGIKRLPHALLAQGPPRRLRASEHRDDDREVPRGQRRLSALPAAVHSNTT